MVIFGAVKTVEVPNVVGMSQAQAEETLKAENLRVEVAETFERVSASRKSCFTNSRSW